MPYTKLCTNTCQEHVNFLIVDDSQADIRLIHESMKDSRIFCCISSVNSGEECLKYLRKEEQFAFVNTPDIIFMDVNMPGMSGIDTLKKIREDDALKHHIVIMLTCSSDDADILRSYELACQAYATKPVDLDEFKKMMTHLGDFYFGVVKNSNKKIICLI